MNKYLSFLLCIWMSAESAASGNIAGQVVRVRIDKDGRGVVIFDRAIGGIPPACVTSDFQNALSFDFNTAGGKAIMAMALAAKTTASVISAYGAGNCSIYGGYVEDWTYGTLQ